MSMNDRQWFQSTPVEKDGRVLVQSRCVICGLILIGSVTENLLDQQQEHIESTHPQAMPARTGD